MCDIDRRGNRPFEKNGTEENELNAEIFSIEFDFRVFIRPFAVNRDIVTDDRKPCFVYVEAYNKIQSQNKEGKKYRESLILIYVNQTNTFVDRNKRAVEAHQ